MVRTHFLSSIFSFLLIVLSPQDRPLIAQFCANDPALFLQAATFLVGSVDAVDLNLGCPQHIARRGYYGAFLQENPELIFRLINHVHTHLPIPITAKIRILETEEETLRYAKMVQDAGAQLLTVHGRTRKQKGQFAGHSNWEMIKKVKESLSIPVIANGSIERWADVDECARQSCADGFMAAQGLLRNPALFSFTRISEVDLAEEYLDFVDKYPVRTAMVRAHLFKILQATCSAHPELLTDLSNFSLAEFRNVIVKIRKISSVLYYNDNFDDSWTFPSRHSAPSPAAYDTELLDGVGGMFHQDDS